MTRPILRGFAALVLGAGTVAGFAPLELFPLPLLTLALLFRLWHGASARQAAQLGFVFGLGMFLAGISWVYVSMHEFGGMPAWLAALAAFLFCSFMALYPALAGYVFARLRCGGRFCDALVGAASWTLTEWLRGGLFTGFPWLALGYAQTPPSPFAGFAPLFGVYGVGFFVALSAVLWGLTFAGPASSGPRRWGVPLGVTALLLAAGQGLRTVEWTQPAGPAFSVSLLQGNIEQSLKWQPGRLIDSMDTYRHLATGHPAQLIVLPETALPLLLDQLPHDYVEALRASTTDAAGDVLFGIAAQDERGRYYNSAVAVTDERVQAYRKHHLVPFGEFVPPAFAWTLALMRIPMSNFSPGPAKQSPLELGGQRVAVNICYEDLFGEEIIRALPQATVLVNLSNTAWFGRSLAQPQHLQIARLRALETGRMMLRATNTGMTAIIDVQGRTRQVLPPFTRAALHGEVRGYQGMTPYARWGNGLVLLIAFFGLWAPRLAKKAGLRCTAT